MPAFSLIEILVVMIIVGIILTLPKWPLIGDQLLNKADNRLAIAQNKLDTVLLQQANSTSQKVITVELEPLCEKKEVAVYTGGWLKPISLTCGARKITVTVLGQLLYDKP
jgi:prepilin-type N-terminal cleavage/methylation domain-containing protein